VKTLDVMINILGTARCNTVLVFILLKTDQINIVLKTGKAE